MNTGLNLNIIGYGGTVTAQSLPMGAVVKRGEVITLTVLILDSEE